MIFSLKAHFYAFFLTFADIAQLVERIHGKDEVRGSIPRVGSVGTRPNVLSGTLGTGGERPAVLRECPRFPARLNDFSRSGGNPACRLHFWND